VQLQLDVLPVDGRVVRADAAEQRTRGGERTGGQRGSGSSGQLGSEASLEGYVLADGDLRLLVVAGEEVRRAEHVHVRALLERVQDDAEGGNGKSQLAEGGDGRPLQSGEEPTVLGEVGDGERRRDAAGRVLRSHDAHARAL